MSDLADRLKSVINEMFRPLWDEQNRRLDELERAVARRVAEPCVYEVVGQSGKLYSVPREVWDQVDPRYRRVMHG